MGNCLPVHFGFYEEIPHSVNNKQFCIDTAGSPVLLFIILAVYLRTKATATPPGEKGVNCSTVSDLPI